MSDQKNNQNNQGKQQNQHKHNTQKNQGNQNNKNKQNNQNNQNNAQNNKRNSNKKRNYNRNRSRKNRNNFHNNRDNRNNENQNKDFDLSDSLPVKPDWEVINCCYCFKPVTNLYTAISIGETSRAHFSCVIKDIKSKEKLEKDEEVIYLGGGSFGIVRNVKNDGTNFFIRKRIQIEDENKTVQWRKDISADLKKRKN